MRKKTEKAHALKNNKDRNVEGEKEDLNIILYYAFLYSILTVWF